MMGFCITYIYMHTCICKDIKRNLSVRKYCKKPMLNSKHYFPNSQTAENKRNYRSYMIIYKPVPSL